METVQFKTNSAQYTVYLDVQNPGLPYSIFLHGGPGFNCYGERQVLPPFFRSKLNFIWFDLLGCSESPAVSSEKITWDAQIEDVIRIIKQFSNGPVNVIAHCLGAHLTHDLVLKNHDLVRKVVWYAPVVSVSGVFKRVLTRAISENRLDFEKLDISLQTGINDFFQTPDEKFSQKEVMLLLQLLEKIRDFQELYWLNRGAMQAYLQWMTIKPFNPEVFVRLQIQFFQRGPQPFPSYEGIPVLMLRSDNDLITPFESNVCVIADRIPHAEIRTIRNGFHWLQFEKTEECAKNTVEFLLR